MMRWAPNDFWASNVWEITHAINGFAKLKGVKRKNATALSQEEINKVDQLLEKEKRRKWRQSMS